MKYLGTFTYFLIIEVAYSHRGYLLAQFKYIVNIIEQTHILILDQQIAPWAQCEIFLLWWFSSIGSHFVSYWAWQLRFTITRPDIAYEVLVLSQFVIYPTILHWAIVFCILQYLRGTQFQSLLSPSSSSLKLNSYSNVGWVGDPTDHNFTTGFCFFLWDSVISWMNTKQDIISHSSIEAEYHSMETTTLEIMLLCWSLSLSLPYILWW